MFIDDMTCNDSSKGSAEQECESVDPCSEAALPLGDLICDNGTPRRVGEVVTALQQEEEQSEHRQEYTAIQIRRKCKGNQDEHIEDCADDHEGTAMTHTKGDVVGDCSCERVDDDCSKGAPSNDEW